jgi:hypothetical protein
VARLAKLCHAQQYNRPGGSGRGVLAEHLRSRAACRAVDVFFNADDLSEPAVNELAVGVNGANGLN